MPPNPQFPLLEQDLTGTGPPEHVAPHWASDEQDRPITGPLAHVAPQSEFAEHERPITGPLAQVAPQSLLAEQERWKTGPLAHQAPHWEFEVQLRPLTGLPWHVPAKAGCVRIAARATRATAKGKWRSGLVILMLILLVLETGPALEFRGIARRVFYQNCG